MHLIQVTAHRSVFGSLHVLEKSPSMRADVRRLPNNSQPMTVVLQQAQPIKLMELAQAAALVQEEGLSRSTRDDEQHVEMPPESTARTSTRGKRGSSVAADVTKSGPAAAPANAKDDRYGRRCVPPSREPRFRILHIWCAAPEMVRADPGADSPARSWAPVWFCESAHPCPKTVPY